MKTIIALLLIVYASSCSQVNTESKQYYNEQKSAHGIVKVSSAEFKPSVRLKTSPKLIADGKKLYQQHCLSCHGKDGRGDGPKAKDSAQMPMDLRLAVRETEHFAFYTRYSYWDGSMPGWSREFSDYELDA